MARRLSAVLATVGAMMVPALAVMAAPALAAEGSGCRCLYQGKSFDQGELVCIHVGGKTRLARCGMLLNNSSWQFVQNGCPSALMTVLPPGRLAGLAGIAPPAIE